MPREVKYYKYVAVLTTFQNYLVQYNLSHHTKNVNDSMDTMSAGVAFTLTPLTSKFLSLYKALWYLVR